MKKSFVVLAVLVVLLLLCSCGDNPSEDDTRGEINIGSDGEPYFNPTESE